MADAGGATDVEVVTDLAITGKPAQFGRGVMQDVSDKLLGQFVACLETRLAGGVPEPSGEAGPAVAAPAAPTAPTTPAPAAPTAAAPPTAFAPPTAPAAPAAAARPAERSAAQPPRHAANDDALDLGAAVLPVLAKAYWKQAVGALAVIALIWWFVSRD